MTNVPDIAIDGTALDAARHELALLLARLVIVTSTMTTMFEKLALDPARYTDARDEIDNLATERRTLLQRVGEIATSIFTLDAKAEEPSITATATVADEAVVARFISSATPIPTSQRSPEKDRSLLSSLADHVNIASVTPGDVEDEITMLERACADARVPHWKKMSFGAQVRWVEILVAWAKALEGEVVGDQRVLTAFNALRTFSKYDSPRYIHGFARDARPMKSWRVDAAEKLAALRGRTAQMPESKKTPRVEPDDDEDDDQRDARIPEDWPFAHHVRGKNVVMIGGDVREERRVALEREFKMASLDWVPHKRPRLLQALAERAANGTIDLILVNKYVAHKDTAALERASVVPVITVRFGYGVTACRAAIEDRFGRSHDAG